MATKQSRGSWIAIGLVVSLISICGCRNQDRIVREMAADALEQQAAQNQAMAELNREVAVAMRRLSEEQTQARQAHQSAEQQIRSQLDTLEAERREIATQRHRDPIVAAAILRIGLIAACLTPLLLCWKLLASTEGESAAEAVNTVLLEDFLSEERRFLSRSNSQSRTLLPRAAQDSPPSTDAKGE